MMVVVAVTERMSQSERGRLNADDNDVESAA